MVVDRRGGSPDEGQPKSMADAETKASAKYKPNNSQDVVKLDDGWAADLRQRGRDLGPIYFVQARREIAGKGYWCETTASNPEQQANALAFCKSLKP